MLAIIDRRRKDPPRPLALGRVEMAEKRMLAISGRSMYMAPGTKSNTRHPSRFRSWILCYAMMLCYATVFLFVERGPNPYKSKDIWNWKSCRGPGFFGPSAQHSKLRTFAKKRDLSEDRFFFVENGPNPYNKNNQLKMKVGTFLESYVYCLVNLFRMFKKCAKNKCR